MPDVLLMILRRLRAPLIILVLVYAVSVGGLTLMPGMLPDGTPARLGFFHAFYVVTYTATTIGFGEVPYPFTDAQRLWLTVTIYIAVIGWTYALASVFALVNDRAFRAAVARSLFARRVRGIVDPFVIICGYGQSGATLARALDRIGLRLVVVELHAERAAHIAIEDYRSPPLVLAADARLPDVLADAGIAKPECEGLIALAGDDSANQAIAIGARTLVSGMKIVARAKAQVAQANLEAFGGMHVINPFETFATNLALGLDAPEALQLEEWLTASPGTPLPKMVEIPRGTWILVGYGRFGQAISRVLDDAGIPWKAIDPQVDVDDAQHLSGGDNIDLALREAGVAEAEVLVAGTDVDAVNLGVTTLARRINPDIFVVIRENQSADRVLIEAARARLRFVQSELMVHECLQVLKTPMLGRFLWRVRGEGREFARQVIERLTAAGNKGAPRAWRFQCDVMQPGMFTAFFQKSAEPLRIQHLLADPADPARPIAANVLMCERRQETILLPPQDMVLKPGDQLLFVGREAAQRLQARYLSDPHSVEFALTGVEPTRSWVLRRLAERRRRARLARQESA
ncbi:MAG: NAD-binding protein [Burkholderiaceae bacterium]